MKTRRLIKDELVKLIDLAHRNFYEVNSKDYSDEAIQGLVDRYNEEKVTEIFDTGHIYAVLDGENIVGVGAITPHGESMTESILLSIFVNPDCQGKGVGKIVMDALESDEIFLNSEKVVLNSSITAAGFYEKLGYAYKDNEKKLQVGDYYKMEKIFKKR